MSVTAKHISVRVGCRTLLKRVDFLAQAGQVTAIVGPSGAGKSTLLSVLSGDIGYEGDVCLNGANIQKRSAADLAQHRAVLAQSTPLAFPFTVREVVQLGAAAGMTPEVVSLALAQVGMSDFDQAFYQSLSGGEQQRVQLARVLCQVWHPVKGGVARWLFLDEPVSSLDIGHQLRVMQIARRFADQGGGVVVVLHDLNLTAMFAESAVLMHDGDVVVQGAPETVLTAERLGAAYGCDIHVNAAPKAGFYMLPQLASVPRLRG